MPRKKLPKPGKENYEKFVLATPEFTPGTLKMLRKKLYLTQDEMAKLISAGGQAYRGWEYGKSQMPKAIWAYCICQYKALREHIEMEYPTLKKLEGIRNDQEKQRNEKQDEEWED